MSDERLEEIRGLFAIVDGSGGGCLEVGRERTQRLARFLHEVYGDRWSVAVVAAECILSELDREPAEG